MIFLLGYSLKNKISNWAHKYFSRNAHEDPLWRIFSFGHEDKPLVAFALKGIIHEQDEPKTIRDFGDSMGISMKPSLMEKYGFNNGKKARQHFIQITECVFLKPNSAVIVICREQDEIK